MQENCWKIFLEFFSVSIQNWNSIKNSNYFHVIKRWFLRGLSVGQTLYNEIRICFLGATHSWLVIFWIVTDPIYRIILILIVVASASNGGNDNIRWKGGREYLHRKYGFECPPRRNDWKSKRFFTFYLQIFAKFVDCTRNFELWQEQQWLRVQNARKR